MNSRFWLKSALKRAAARRAPSRIPMSGDDRLRERDYYSVTLDAAEEYSYLFDAVTDEAVLARPWNGHRYIGPPLPIPLKHFVGRPIEIRYYLRNYEFLATDTRRFEIGSLLGWYRLIARFQDVKQSIFNNKSLATRRRFDLLDMLIKEALDDHGKQFTVYGVLQVLHGDRIARHPKYQSLFNYYTLLLESLKDEDLLTSDNGSYRIAPRALTAFNRYEDEERRHIDSQKTQRSVKWITFVAGAATVIQALGAWDAMDSTVTKFVRWVFGL